MKRLLVTWCSAAAMLMTVAGCGGGSSSNPPPPVPLPPNATLAEKIAAAAQDPANDTSTNSVASFKVLQDLGVPAVTVKSPPVVNFTVFSDGAVVKGLTAGNARFAIAKLVPASNGNPDQWTNYVYREEIATPGVGPGGKPVLAKAMQATTDPGSDAQLVYHDDGYYTYTFSTDITDPTKTNGVKFEPNRTHRIAIQLSYTNAAGETVLVNPYMDVRFDADGKSAQVTNPALTRKMTDVSSCNSCHEKLALHGGGRVDTQYCVMCHNPGTTDANSGNVLTLSTMAHKIHSGRLLKSALDEGKGGEDYTIWGFRDSKHSYAEVGFPQDLRNCSKCHSADNPATPQGDNWKTAVSKQACLTCHANRAGSDWDASHEVIARYWVGIGAKAKDLTNQQCNECHKAGTNLGSDRVHFNQVEVNAAKYKMNIASVALTQPPTDTTDGTVEVKYFLSDPTNGDAKYKLEDDPGRFGRLSLYLTYQSMRKPDKADGTKDETDWAVTEFTSYNNGGNKARVDAITGTNDGGNVYTATIAIPMNSAFHRASGTGRVVSIGAVVERKLEAKSATDPRPPVEPAETVNTLVQNTFKDIEISGTLNPRRLIVSNDKCNTCHGALGATSGSNTLANAFHGGARNTVEACVVCHDPNRAGSSIMTNGLPLIESYQFKRMIHGIHGNSKRVYPFTHGNKVAGQFGKDGLLMAAGEGALVSNLGERGPRVDAPSGVLSEPWLTGEMFAIGTPLAADVENYAAEVAYPQVGLNCNTCHVDNSYKTDKGPVGTVVSKSIDPATHQSAGTDPMQWSVISPKAATCTACHDSPKAIGHVTGFGNATFADRTQRESMQTQETCADCHASGGFKGVDIVHGQK